MLWSGGIQHALATAITALEQRGYASMEKFLSEVQARPYSLKNVPLDALQQIWQGLCAVISNHLRMGKVRP